MLLVHTAPVTPFFYVASLGFSSTRSWGGGVAAVYCHNSPNQDFYLFQRVITGNFQRTFRRYISTSSSPELAIYRLLSSRLLALRARVGHLKASLYPLSLLFSSLGSSSKLDLVHNPDLPSNPAPTVRRWRSDRPGLRVSPWVAPAHVGHPGSRLPTAGSSRHVRLPQGRS